MEKLSAELQAGVRKMSSDRIIKAFVKAGVFSEEQATALDRDSLLDAYVTYCYVKEKPETAGVSGAEAGAVPKEAVD